MSRHEEPSALGGSSANELTERRGNYENITSWNSKIDANSIEKPEASLCHSFFGRLRLLPYFWIFFFTQLFLKVSSKKFII